MRTNYLLGTNFERSESKVNDLRTLEHTLKSQLTDLTEPGPWDESGTSSRLDSPAELHHKPLTC
jgi:hypothetical protein